MCQFSGVCPPTKTNRCHHWLFCCLFNTKCSAVVLFDNHFFRCFNICSHYSTPLIPQINAHDENAFELFKPSWFRLVIQTFLTIKWNTNFLRIESWTLLVEREKMHLLPLLRSLNLLFISIQPLAIHWVICMNHLLTKITVIQYHFVKLSHMLIILM